MASTVFNGPPRKADIARLGWMAVFALAAGAAHVDCDHFKGIPRASRPPSRPLPRSPPAATLYLVLLDAARLTVAVGFEVRLPLILGRGDRSEKRRRQIDISRPPPEFAA